MKSKLEQYDQKSAKVRGKLAKSHAETSLSSKENELIHGTYQFENLMLSCRSSVRCLQASPSREKCSRESWRPIPCGRQRT